MGWWDRDELIMEVDSKDHALLNEVVERILGKVTATEEFDIEVQIHDLLLKNVKYVNKEKVTEHTIEGPLLNKKAVCEGIAKATKYLLNRKGIECELVLGKLKEDQSVFHAWNVVRIDGVWYHIDVTADIGISDGGNHRYDYFNLSDEEISADHIILDSPVECTTSKQTYYHRKGMVVNTQKQFKELLTGRLDEGETEVTIKLPSTKDPDNVTRTVIDRSLEAMVFSKRKYRHVEVRPNTTQLVFTIIVS